MYQLRDTATYLKNKTVVLCLAVLAGAVLLIFIGASIKEAVLNGAEQEARMYQTALQTTDDNQLNYSIDTKQNYVLAPVTIKSVDLVKFPEMNKSFVAVTKTEERYTQHEREVCETKYRTETHYETVTNSDGTTSTEAVTEEVPYEECHQETYYTWDFVQDWRESAKEVDMAGRKYPIDKFSLGMHGVQAKDIIDGEKGEYVIKKAEHWLDIDLWGEADEGDIRYSYDVLELPQSGTVFLKLTDGVNNARGSKISLDSRSSKDIVKSVQDAVHTKSTVFTVFWTILVLCEIGFGLYAVWVYKSEYSY